jgi:hypothetical protein
MYAPIAAGAVALEEGLRHLRASGVVIANEEHIASRLSVGSLAVMARSILLH